LGQLGRAANGAKAAQGGRSEQESAQLVRSWPLVACGQFWPRASPSEPAGL